MLNIKTSSIIQTLAILTVISACATSAWAHNAAISDQPVLACESKSLKDKCSYANKSGDLYRGSCQSFSDTLMCVRNLPIIKADNFDEPADEDNHSHEHITDMSTHTHGDS